MTEEPFYQHAVKFVEFMSRMPKPSAPPTGTQGPQGPREKTVATLVTSWHGTVVPFYNILLGVRAALDGYQVKFLWDDLIWQDPETTLRHNKLIEQVLALAAPYGSVDVVSRHSPLPMDDGERRELERMADLNALWKFRDPERSAEYEEFRRTCRGNFIANYPRSKAALAATGAATALIPGGIVGDSGLFMLASRKAGIRPATYDCGPRQVLVGVDDVAAHLFDLSKVIEMPGFRARPEDLPWIKAESERFFGERIQGTDSSRYQVVGTGDSIAKDDLDVLMALNVMWDSAAMGRHNVFEDSVQWVMESVAWILGNTGANVVVRQHPAERVWQKRFQYQNSMGQKLQDRFGLGTRLRYIRAEEERNTYEMMAQARLLLPATSTVGLEAVLLGIPVVTECRQYYTALPGVVSARSREEYFAGIKAALTGPRRLDAAIPPEAWTIYYFSQKCNPCNTQVTAMPEDYDEWIRWDAARVLSDESFGTVCKAMLEGAPVSYLNYRKLAEARRKG